jgi:hypothetical protein
MSRLAALPGDAFGVVALVLLLTALLTPPLAAYELAWELSASLGYAACVALVLCFRSAPLAPERLSVHSFKLHRFAGHAAAALVVAHVAVPVAVDPFVLDYLGWQAPRHVLFGMLAALALVAALAIREPQLPARLRRGGKRLHAALGVAAVAGLLGHVWVSSAKPITAWQGALVLAALFLPTLPALGRLLGARFRPWRLPEPIPASTGAPSALLLLLGVVIVVLVAAPRMAAFLRS